MRRQFAKDILVAFGQCILQTRIKGQNQSIRKIDQFFKQCHHETNLDDFLAKLPFSQQFNIRQKIRKNSEFHYLSIGFYLQNKNGSMLAQTWSINMEWFCEEWPENCTEQIKLLSSTLQELFRLLINQPLFQEFKKFKSEYCLDFLLYFEENSDNIFQMKRKLTKNKICTNFELQLFTYYHPQIQNIQAYLQQRKLKEHTKKKRSSHKKRLSLYQFYDKDLDFVFLASDDQSLTEQDLTQIDIDDSSQFQLLVLSKDDEFLENSKKQFNKLSAYEYSYFQT